MCPPPEGGPQGAPSRPPRRGRKSIEHWHLWNWLEDERKARGVSLRAVARHFGHGNATRVGQYLRGAIVAGPEMVRGLAEAIGVSPVEALWKAGYQGAFFHELVELYKLGCAWCREDQVSVDASSGALFLGPHFVARHDEDVVRAPDSLRLRYHTGTIYNYDEDGRRIFCEVTVPRPIAVAILLAVGYFPRRGDSLRPAANDLTNQLASVAGPMILEAQRVRYRGQHVVVPEILLRAESISKERWIPQSARAALMAEYVHHWASTCCRRYAEYARLALYEKGGVMPFEHAEDPEFNDLWAYRTADMPAVSDVALIEPSDTTDTTN